MEDDVPLIKPKAKTSIWTKAFAILIILTMVSWAAATYVEQDDTNDKSKDKPDFEVNGYPFYIMPDTSFGTTIDIKGQSVPIYFRLDPRNASNISLDETALSEILGASKIYVATNPNQPNLAKVTVATVEIARILPLYDIETVAAFTEDSKPPNSNVPLKTCNDTKGTTKVIYLYVDNETTAITNVDGCIHVSGKDANELISAADKLGYNLVGIRV